MAVSHSCLKFKKSKKQVIIVLFAHPPCLLRVAGCGHCKKAKPEFQNAASKFADDKKVCLNTNFLLRVWDN